MKHIVTLCMLCILIPSTALAARAKIEERNRDPYISALVLDAATGEILIEENSRAVVYPASVLKMMVLLIVLEKIESGAVLLDDIVQVTDEAARMGGSQVYLDPKEQFSLEDLLYALTIQSANDAAVALATHVAGSKDRFIALMNQRARQLGMKDTVFRSVHGLPPAHDQQPDVTTARDLAILCLELARRPQTFAYTSTKERGFRNGEFMMRTHNHLLNSVEGCDGFKTGYFKAAGFSIAATAQRNGVRIIALVLGSQDRKVRDTKATELLARGFSLVPTRPKSAQASASVPTPETLTKTTVQQIAETAAAEPLESTEQAAKEETSPTRKTMTFFFGWLAGIASATLFFMYRSRKRPKRNRRIV